MRKTLTPLLLSLLPLTTASKFIPTEECPLLGPTFSSDFDFSKTEAFTRARASFPKAIDAVIESGVIGKDVSFYIDVYSTYTNESIYSYNHKATEPSMNETITTGEIDDDTVFRVGSVSKMYTAYAIIAHAGGLEVMNEPVTKYVPELAGNKGKDPLEYVMWEDITVGALMSQQGGSGQFSITSLMCYVKGDNSSCSTEDFLKTMRDANPPTQLVFQSALYNDGGWGILGIVLNRMTGLSYNDALGSLLRDPLGLNSTVTYRSSSTDLNAIIIPGLTSAWGTDNPIVAPSGGIYSNAHDLRKTGLSILHSTLLPARVVRSWLKPRAHTASLTNSLGAPWEISRLTLPISTNSTRYRTSDLYTKAGGQPGYTAVFALSPDHGIGYSVLVAGATAGTARWPLRALAGEVFISAAEEAGMENAGRNYAGVFESRNNTSSNLTLTVDPNKPGIGLDSWFVEGVDWRANVTTPGIPLPEGVEMTIRLYPTGIEESVGDGVERVKYRAVGEGLPTAPRAKIEGGESLFDDGCIASFSVAFYDLFGVAHDEFVFMVRDGTLIGVEVPSAKTYFGRV